MTHPKPDGSLMLRIIDDLEEITRQNGKLMTTALTRLVAGEDERVAQILPELLAANTEVQHILNLILRDRYQDAETAAMQLAASYNKGVSNER